MRDNEIRGVVLNKYYERRREGFIELGTEEFGGKLTDEEIFYISDQLGEHDLIQWKQLSGIGGPMAGMGKISAQGIDVVEGKIQPPIAIHIEDKSIKISGSHGVIVGNNNNQTFHFHMEQLIQAINSKTSTPLEKEEAKSLLKKFLEHPLVSAIAGGAMGLLT